MPKPAMSFAAWSSIYPPHWEKTPSSSDVPLSGLPPIQTFSQPVLSKKGFSSQEPVHRELACKWNPRSIVRRIHHFRQLFSVPVPSSHPPLRIRSNLHHCCKPSTRDNPKAEERNHISVFSSFYLFKVSINNRYQYPGFGSRFGLEIISFPGIGNTC